jgi:hypothetical protein
MNFPSRSLYALEITLVSIEYEAGWAPEPVWNFGEETNLLPLLRFEPRTVLLVANRYTCYALMKCNFLLISLTVIMRKIKFVNDFHNTIVT